MIAAWVILSEVSFIARVCQQSKGVFYEECFGLTALGSQWELDNCPCFASAVQSLKHIWEMREFGPYLHGMFLGSCKLNITFLAMVMSLYSHLQGTYLFM